jgi:iron complex transport system ATP-binding protein
MPILRLENVGYALDRHTILRGISFGLQPGECVGLVGPNGSGKTTLLRTAAGLLAPDVGQILLTEQPLTQLKRREIARQIGYVPQQANLDFNFSVREVVLMGRNPYLSRFEVENESDRCIARQALELADLTHLVERLVTTLSGGERQRVVIARALAQQSRLLLLDEPTASLDLRHQHEIMALLVRLSQEHNLAILVALHDLNLAARYCNRLIVLNRARLLADGRPAEVLTPELMAQVFEVEATICPDETAPGRVQIVVQGVLTDSKDYKETSSENDS